MAAKCVSRKCAVVTLVISVVLFLVSLILLICFPKIFNYELNKELSLVDGSLAYGLWKDIPLPIYEKLYFFNITNRDKFLNKKEKMKVEQVGPYTYEAKWVKENVAWFPNNTVTYAELRTYHFVPEMSNGLETDKIYTLNGPMIMASEFLKDASFWEKIGAAIFFGVEGEHIITKRSIQELSYKGYEDPIIKNSYIIKSDIPFKNGIFSWLYGKNASTDGFFTVFTGEDDIRKLNVINNWNGEGRLDFWGGDSCNMINGSSGELGPPLKEDQQTYSFFQSFFCRTITFNYSGDVNHFGLKAKRYSATYEIFANGSENPDNVCFDTKSPLPSGVLNISSCQFGAPVLLSFPHFYFADSTYKDSIIGLDAGNASEKYSSYIDVDPKTGMSLNLKIRFQLNLKLSQVDDILQFTGIPEGIFPVLWAEISVEMTEKFANYLHRTIAGPKTTAYAVLGVVMGVSVILIVLSIVILLIYKENKNKDEPLLSSNADETNYATFLQKNPENTCCNKKVNIDKQLKVEKDEPSVQNKSKNSETKLVVPYDNDDDDDLLLESEKSNLK